MDNNLYISFHKPGGLIGAAISLWTWGKYSHVEFVYRGCVYLANPGGVRVKPFVKKKNADIFKVSEAVDPEAVIDFFYGSRGRGYDYLGILGQAFYARRVQDNEKYFCSEFCLNALDYAMNFTLEDKGKKFSDMRNYAYSPSKLFKYLQKINLIGKEKTDV